MQEGNTFPVATLRSIRDERAFSASQRHVGGFNVRLSKDVRDSKLCLSLFSLTNLGAEGSFPI